MTKFYLQVRDNGANATGEYHPTDGRMMVLKDSVVSPSVSDSMSENYRNEITNKRARHCVNKIVTEDIPFGNPSIAASFVTGTSRNGWKSWVDENGKTLDELYRSKNNKKLDDYEAEGNSSGDVFFDDEDTSNSIIDEESSMLSIQPFAISKIIDAIKKTNLIYTSSLLQRFAFSLLTKPFVILSGLSGSGKTQLALAFAKCLIQDDSQLCLVPVGADWTNREPLLGYPNGLNHDEYIKPESGVLELLINANKNQDRPYFLILDEMNLSYVERYFADFLSAMESKENIPLWNGSDKSDVPPAIPLPKNVFIIGTINVDETTYMFSPKVLDRANVIEFKIDLKEMSEYLNKPCNIDIGQCYQRCADMAADFVKIAKQKCDLDKIDGNERMELFEALKKLFEALKKVNAEFGYRTASEIQRFLTIAKTCDVSLDGHASEISERVMSKDDIMDAAIVQKLLPKLHGSRKKLEPTLNALWQICLNNSNSTLPEGDKVPDGAKYKLSADKILRMYRTACENGFTSFAEA